MKVVVEMSFAEIPVRSEKAALNKQKIIDAGKAKNFEQMVDALNPNGASEEQIEMLLSNDRMIEIFLKS